MSAIPILWLVVAISAAVIVIPLASIAESLKRIAAALEKKTK
jgi:hypothetical protein